MELLKVHPPFVHFAIGLSFALLVLELYYRFTGKQPDRLHLIFTLLSSLFIVGAAVSGYVAYESQEEKLHRIQIFEVHESLGMFLGAYGVVLLAVRLGFERLGFLRKIFTFMVLFGFLAVLFQGSLGGSVVYDHMVKPWLEQP